METRVANVRDGWPENAVYIGRPGKGHDGYFGNPFKMDRYGDRERVVQLYRNWFYRRLDSDPKFRRRVEELRGKTLMCFCAPLQCHGDVIAEYLSA